MNQNIVSVVRITAVSLLGLLIGGYGLFQAHKYIEGPVVAIDSPQNGVTYNSPLIEVEGHTKNVAYLTLDGRQIFTDTSGRFDEKLLLSPGYTILTLVARDKFGKVVSKQVQLILKEY